MNTNPEDISRFVSAQNTSILPWQPIQDPDELIDLTELRYQDKGNSRVYYYYWPDLDNDPDSVHIYCCWRVGPIPAWGKDHGWIMFRAVGTYDETSADKLIAQDILDRE